MKGDWDASACRRPFRPVAARLSACHAHRRFLRRAGSRRHRDMVGRAGAEARQNGRLAGGRRRHRLGAGAPGRDGTAYMQATSALFASVNTLSPEFFRNLVERLRVTYDLNGVVGLGWSDVVEREDMPALRTRMAKAGFVDFGLSPVEAPAQWPVNAITMLEPQTRENKALIGLDLHREARRAEAMDRARAKGAISATDPVQLAQDAHRARAPGMIVLAPVWSFDPERRFKGFVFMPIRIAGLRQGGGHGATGGQRADRDLRHRAGGERTHLFLRAQCGTLRGGAGGTGRHVRPEVDPALFAAAARSGLPAHFRDAGRRLRLLAAAARLHPARPAPQRRSPGDDRSADRAGQGARRLRFASSIIASTIR